MEIIALMVFKDVMVLIEHVVQRDLGWELVYLLEI
jgi:hypothetical protein